MTPAFRPKKKSVIMQSDVLKLCAKLNSSMHGAYKENASEKLAKKIAHMLRATAMQP